MNQNLASIQINQYTIDRMDEIQAKLKQFERELTPHRWLLSIPQKAPLLGPALGLMAGIILQYTLSPRLIVWTTLTLGLLAFWLISTKTWTLSTESLLIPAIMSMILLGATLTLYKGRRGPSHIAHQVQDKAQLITLQGRVLNAPRRKSTDTDPNRPRHRTQWTLACEFLQTTQNWQSCEGNLTVTLYDQAPSLQRGDRVQLSGWLRSLRRPTNPGQFDRAAYLERRGIAGHLIVKSQLACRILEHASPWSPTRLHQRLIDRAGFLHDLGRPATDPYGLSKALILGRRDTMPSAFLIAFRKTGLLHLISLSGMHIGILASMAWALGWTLRLLKPGKAWITALCVLIFVLIVPPRSATLRTAIICWVFGLGHILRRPSNALNLLSLAAILLLCLNPLQLFDIGWQLSFACVLSILLFFPRLYGLAQRGTRYCFSNASTVPLRWLHHGLQVLTALLCTGLSAWLGGAGILLFNFHTLTPLSPLWTLLALPWVYLIFALGLLKIIAGLFSTSLCATLAFPIMGLERLLAQSVESLAHHASGIWVVGQTSGLWVLVYYVALLGTLLPAYRHRRHLRVWTTCSLMMVLAAVTWTAHRNDHPPCPRITLLDVGHGQAALVQHPDGSTLLFDAGSLYNPAIGEHVINPFLNHCGIDRLDVVIISHPDRDHLNGLSDVLSRARASVIYTPSLFVHRLRPYLQGCPPTCIPPIRPLPPNGNLGDDLTWETWWPRASQYEGELNSDNNLSAVLKLSYSDHSLLFCSDIEQPTQQKLLQNPPGPACELVIAPHHGSSRTLLPGFLDRMGRGRILASCGKGRSSVENPHFLRTCEVGAIQIQWPPEDPICLLFGTHLNTP